jgi:hypothetical protein
MSLSLHVSELSPREFRQLFHERYPPLAANQIVKVVESSTEKARSDCEDRFKSGIYGPTQGALRYQYIQEELQLLSGNLDGNLIPEIRDFRGSFASEGERKWTFTLLKADDVGMIFCRASKYKKLPKKSRVRGYLASLPFSMSPLFNAGLQTEELPPELRALYLTRFWIDEFDARAARLEKIDVVVLDRTQEAEYCKIVDLRAYAADINLQEDVQVIERLPIQRRDRAKRRSVVYVPADGELTSDRDQVGTGTTDFKDE